MPVISSDINTLRFGHALKFLEAIPMAWITVVLCLRFGPTRPLAAQLILLATGTFALLVVSEILSWCILGEAEFYCQQPCRCSQPDSDSYRHHCAV